MGMVFNTLAILPGYMVRGLYLMLAGICSRERLFFLVIVIVVWDTAKAGVMTVLALDAVKQPK
jgi:hypothetical protein